jgi:hypothetical protein
MTDRLTMTRAQAVRRTLDVSELWVILRTLGVVASSVDAPPEIASAANAAQAKLLQQGLLLSDTAGRLTLAPDLDTLVRPAAFPENVFVASITDHTPSGSVEREVIFSWTPQALVVNWVDEADAHHFEAYQRLEVQDGVWDHLSRLCNLEVDEPDPAAALTSPAIEASVEGMKQAVLLLAINRLQAPEQTAQALSWWVSGRAAWLLQKNEESGPVRLTPSGRAGLETAVSAFVQQAIRSGQPAVR